MQQKRTNIISKKIDEFIRKYYLNRFLQGVLLSIGGVIAYVIIASIIEYYGHFGSTVRAFLFFVFIAFSSVVLYRFMLIPLLRRWKLAKSISPLEASRLIGRHFPEISDKLINTLQLQEQTAHSDNELLIASINQRIQNLTPFSFSSAINLNQSLKKYAKFTIIPLTLLLVLLIFQSNIITKPAQNVSAV
ncbi:MAG: hypothetical protein R2852_07770 [Bacteroidia bacterium]